MNKYEIYQVGDGYLINIEDEFTVYSFYDIPKQIIDIIKQLEQENKQLKKQLELEIKVRDEIHNYLHNKIDKAIELIKNKTKIIPLEEGGGLELCDYDIQNLLEILKDSDVDE